MAFAERGENLRAGDAWLRPVVFAHLVEGEHLLMVQQGLGRERGCGNLPGGKAELGEGLTAAAMGVAREKTGYRVTTMGLRGAASWV